MEAEDRARTTSGRADGPDGAALRTREGPDRPTLGARDPSSHERCTHHPGRLAVARCDTCGEPVCLTCAVPVRGRVLGPECLAAELGDPALTTPPEPDRTVVGAWWSIAGAVLALLATTGPWTRAGAGDRLFGAWVPSLRWSMLAAVTATALVPAAWWFRSRGPERAAGAARLLVALGGAGVVAASALAIAFPPTFQAAAWGPWLAVAGGAVAVAGTLANAVVERRPTQGV